MPSYLSLLLILLAGLTGLQVSASAASSPIQANSPAYGPVGPQQSGSTTIQAEVLNITSRFEGSLIYSYVTLLVTQVVAGLDIPRGTQIVLRIVGGEVNGTLLWVSNQPYFFVGENVEISVQQEGNVYLPISPKKSITGSVRQATTAGYVLQWYKPGVGWQTSTTRPDLDWYGPFRWSSGTLDYWINPQGIPSDVLPSSFISYATASFQTWQDDPGSAITSTYEGTRTDLTPGSEDGVNVVGWGYLGGSTIAVTDSWAQYTPGTYDSLRFTETDMIFDNSKLWSAGPSGVSGRYDVQNIGTHEAGHTFGLGDMYDSVDSEQTMYGYSGTGETKKRTLEWGDLAGVATLYPKTYVLHVQSFPISGVLMFHDDFTAFGYTNFDITSPDPFVSDPVVAPVVLLGYSVGYHFDHWELDGVDLGHSYSLGSIEVGSGDYPKERTAVAIYDVEIVVTTTEQSTAYSSATTTTTTTSYTSTTISTSTIPTVTTVVLVPLTITSTAQSTQPLTSFLTTTTTSYTGTTISTSTIPTTVALVQSTVTSIVQSIQNLTSILSTTTTSYTSTETSTSTVVVPTTVVLVPLTATSTVGSTQLLNSTVTTTMTSYTSTVTLTSTIPTVTTVVLLPTTTTSTVQDTQFVTSTLTTTTTSYTATVTSTSTSVVYTTVTVSQGAAGGAGSIPLAYFSFLSMLTITVGHKVVASRPKKRPKVRSAILPPTS